MKKIIIKTNIIKASSLILLALLCGLFASCMNGDWDEPDNTQAPFGNNSLTESNVITIADLIKKYPNVFASTDQNQEITEDIQIKGRVTGNDLGGNIYKQIILQDTTAAIIIAVNEGGLFGHLAEGQEILVNLKGLYIGGYRKMPEIGYPYNDNSIGRMQKDIWEKHYKIIGTPDTTVIKAVDFNTIKNDMDDNCGKLVTLKGVTFTSADGKSTFTTGSEVGNAVNQTLDSDWPSVENVTPETVRKARKMLRILAALPPQTPKMNRLYAELDTERQHGLKILYALERAGLLNLLASDFDALDNLSSPEKIYCENTNLMYALTSDADIGTAREAFFVNQLSNGHVLTYPKKGDFMVDDRWLFEVGGRGKGFAQIKDMPDSYVVNDGVEVGIGNKIPLWLFGFLY